MHYSSVWSPESTRKRKKNAEENDFFLFGSTVENIKENRNSSKFYIFLNFSGCEALRLHLEPGK